MTRRWRAAVTVFLIVVAGHAAFGLWWASKLERGRPRAGPVYSCAVGGVDSFGGIGPVERAARD